MAEPTRPPTVAQLDAAGKGYAVLVLTLVAALVLAGPVSVGAPTALPETVDGGEPRNPLDPVVVFDSSGQPVVAWAESSLDDPDLFLATVTAGGVQVRRLEPSAGRQRRPSMVPLPGGQLLLAFENGASITAPKVLLARYDADGGLIQSREVDGARPALGLNRADGGVELVVSELAQPLLYTDALAVLGAPANSGRVPISLPSVPLPIDAMRVAVEGDRRLVSIEAGGDVLAVSDLLPATLPSHDGGWSQADVFVTPSGRAVLALTQSEPSVTQVRTFEFTRTQLVVDPFPLVAGQFPALFSKSQNELHLALIDPPRLNFNDGATTLAWRSLAPQARDLRGWSDLVHGAAFTWTSGAFGRDLHLVRYQVDGTVVPVLLPQTQRGPLRDARVSLRGGKGVMVWREGREVVAAWIMRDAQQRPEFVAAASVGPLGSTLTIDALDVAMGDDQALLAVHRVSSGGGSGEVYRLEPGALPVPISQAGWNDDGAVPPRLAFDGVRYHLLHAAQASLWWARITPDGSTTRQQSTSGLLASADLACRADEDCVAAWALRGGAVFRQSSQAAPQSAGTSSGLVAVSYEPARFHVVWANGAAVHDLPVDIGVSRPLLFFDAPVTRLFAAPADPPVVLVSLARPGDDDVALASLDADGWTLVNGVAAADLDGFGNGQGLFVTQRLASTRIGVDTLWAPWGPFPGSDGGVDGGVSRPDGGFVDGGVVDGGTVSVDAGVGDVDAGSVGDDGGVPPLPDGALFASGCNCSSNPTLLLALGLLWAARRRVAPRGG